MTNQRPMVAPHIPFDLDAAKRNARIAARARRQGLDPIAAGQALSGHVLSATAFPAEGAIAAFWPMPDEIDIRPLLHALHRRGQKVALPVTPRRGEPLAFRRWKPGDVLVAERFGTFRPVGEELVPDMLFIPLLAFDITGARLGYGGGFYDRTLAALPGRMKIGCAFAIQQMDAVPVGPYDIRLDAIATERGVIRCGG